MAQKSCSRFAGSRGASTGALMFAGALLRGAGDVLRRGERAGARLRIHAAKLRFPSDDIKVAPTEPALTDQGDGSASVLPERLRRAVVCLEYP